MEPALMLTTDRKPHLARMQLIATLAMVIGAAGIIYGLILYYQQPTPPRQSTNKSINIAQSPSSVKPSTKAVASYTVAPKLPKFIAIPAIGVTRTRVLRLGHLANGQITTPNNVYDTGWYEDSALPGQLGAMFIFGHVSSWTADGVFYNLKKLRPGDTVTITRGDNKQFTYSVVASKIYPYNKVDMRQVLSPINARKPGLNLMTCTGTIIKGTSEFNERLVVFTSLIST